MKPLSQAAKTAVGGMVVALSIVLMLPTAIDLFVYAMPAIAGILTLFCVIELGKSWAFGVYAATSALGAILLPNKQAIVMYIAFFGYYAILKAVFESRFPKVVEYLLKIALFNASMAAAFLFITKVFHITLSEIIDVKEGAWWAKFALPLFVGVGNAAFLFYDFVLTIEATAYFKVLQKKFRKLFRVK